MGCVTPLGSTVDQFWDGVKNGRSGIGVIDPIKAMNFPVYIGGLVKDFDPLKYILPVENKRFDRFITYGLGAAQQAYDDAGLKDAPVDLDRCGVLVGSGIGGLNIFMQQHKAYLEKGYKVVSPFFIPLLITNMLAGQIAIRFKFRGVNFSVSSACATSNHSVGTAFKFIQGGYADVIFAGGAEAAINEMGIAGFIQIQALSKRNDEPGKASRPFDRDRDGFVMADGSGVLVLEELEHAKKRGAKIHAEIIGTGMSDDAYHMAAPQPDGEGAALALKMALADAKLNPEQVDYINMHGTSTPAGDPAECKAIKKAFGDHAKRLCVNSTKSMIGHMLGAAGGVELIATVKCLQEGLVHPTINVENQDPECDLDVVPNTARERPVKVALSNSFGFGGHNGVVAVRKFEG
jgi:3-oxoacyl-[acyl-carrier-protein] synthase II